MTKKPEGSNLIQKDDGKMHEAMLQMKRYAAIVLGLQRAGKIVYIVTSFY